MTKTEAAYIAGLIDGEGSIRVYQKNSRRQYSVVHGCVKIGMTDQVLINWLRSVTGTGNIHMRSNAAHPKWKPCYIIEWSSRICIPLLKQTLPFLKLKKRQAEILLAWNQITTRSRKFVGGRGRRDRVFPDAIRRKRDELIAEISLLNRRGKPLS